jgi:uncharacterized protein YuzE
VAPVITITNDTITGNTLERFDVYSDESATVDTGSQLTNIDVSNVQNTAIGSFDVVYTATDGNTTVTATRTVSVVDTVQPVITITNDTPTGNTLEQFDVYSDAGASVDPGSVLTTDLSQVQNTAIGSFDVVYTATDGNTTVTATRTVSVVDTTPPVITLIGANPYTVLIGTTYVDSHATADGGETVTSDTSQINMSVEGAYTVTYSATDIYNNIGTATRTVNVSDFKLVKQAVFTSSVSDGEPAVALSEDGNTAIVGMNKASTNGAAYIYTRSGSTWSQQQVLGPSDNEDNFGYTVDISGNGNTVIVGATGPGDYQTPGAAYIFTRSGSTWSHQQKIVGTDSEDNDRFGDDVAIDYDGNTVIVGAPLHYIVMPPVNSPVNNIPQAGAAYVFTWSGTTWSQQDKLISTGSGGSTSTADNYFGDSVDISNDGNTAIVGAWNRGYYSSAVKHAAIFTRSGTTWSQQQQIGVANWDPETFAWDVSISGDGNTAAIGAPGRQALYVYTRSGTTWSQQTKLTDLDPFNTTYTTILGYDTAISKDGNTIIASAYGYRVSNNANNAAVGAARAYTRSGTTWSETQLVLNPTTGLSNNDHLGKRSIAISGNSNVAIMSNVNNAVYMFNYELPPNDWFS